jgi:UDP-N-acetylglucosamine 2-epimerase (non-hydrolysing)
MAPIVRLLKETPGVEARVCVTAQHRQMLDQVLELFDIRPDYDLDLMRDNQSLAEISASIFTHLDPILARFQPDWVLVVGDTTTVVTTSQLAYYRRIKLGHIEAGLRTHNKWHPFPEELNRRIATVIADLHFAPTEWSKANLLREGVEESVIRVTGNPVIDALNFVAKQEEPEEITDLLERLGTKEPGTKRLILVTAHRRENFGPSFENICYALQELARRPDVEIVYPVHLNPNVQEPVNRLLRGNPHITLLPPLDYLKSRESVRGWSRRRAYYRRAPELILSGLSSLFQTGRCNPCPHEYNESDERNSATRYAFSFSGDPNVGAWICRRTSFNSSIFPGDRSSRQGGFFAFLQERPKPWLGLWLSNYGTDYI